MRRAPLAALACLSVLAGSPAAADEAGDRDALARCVSVAKAAKLGAASCIGTVQGACFKRPGGDTTAGMVDCTAREIAAWDARLNVAYRAAFAGPSGSVETLRDGGRRRQKGADVLREAQRSWIVFRDRKCEAARLPMEGGTGASLLAGDCMLAETARQAIWLDGLSEE